MPAHMFIHKVLFTIKTYEALTRATTHTDLENTTLHDRSQTLKATSHKSFRMKCPNRKLYGQRADPCLAGAGGRSGELLLFNGCRPSFWGDVSVSELDRGGGTLVTKLFILKWVISYMNFISIKIHMK